MRTGSLTNTPGERSKRSIIFPTMQNIMKLARSASVEEALATARTTPVVEVTPWSETREDGDYLCIPEDAGYDVTVQKMPPRK